MLYHNVLDIPLASRIQLLLEKYIDAHVGDCLVNGVARNRTGCPRDGFDEKGGHGIGFSRFLFDFRNIKGYGRKQWYRCIDFPVVISSLLLSSALVSVAPRKGIGKECNSIASVADMAYYQDQKRQAYFGTEEYPRYPFQRARHHGL